MTDLSRLEASLRTLRTEIATLEPGDDDARRRLAALVGELESALADPARSGERAPLGEQLKSSAHRGGASAARGSRQRDRREPRQHGHLTATGERAPVNDVVPASRWLARERRRAAR